MIDLRSDTITQPTPEMRRAMAEAAVGDDVLCDDPTVIAMEARTAEVLGKEAAIYMPSGTMTNQVAIRAHTEHGDEIIMESGAHSAIMETGAPAALAGVMCRLLEGERGVFTGEQVAGAVRTENVHHPVTKLVCVENPPNRIGAGIWPIEAIADVARVAREHGLAMHLDGARLWNAVAATGISEAEYAAYFDTVSVCFSKGLGAPVGSALAGTREFVARSRRFRKQFGGGMRQAGIIAGGALYALENHRERLAEDHQNARRLAEAAATLPGIEIDLETIQYNIVYMRVPMGTGVRYVEALRGHGVDILSTRGDVIRVVTNMTVSSADIDRVIEAFGKVFGE
ncbi:MAG: low specificity L-threonine aldolase [Planctomycetaceae bacterium]|nr:low specificity L-threonine aldolase [Planctomycetaceae bacterium]